MKQLNWAQTIWTMVIMALMTPLWAVAQNGEDVDDPKPPAETEIICYAAKSKWVCAPADEKQKAHDKAMKLAQQPDDNRASFRRGEVAIQTMDVGNDFSEQVQETQTQAVTDPNSLQAAIKDFIPREDAKQADTKQTNETTVPITDPVIETPTAEIETNNPVVAETSPVATLAQADQTPVSRSQPTTPSASPAVNDFRDWQRNHANQWSFQVVGTSNRHHLDQFIIDQGIDQGPFAVVKTQVNGADWWVVLSGLYDSREQALSQRGLLPASLADKAWVRQIKTIVGQAD